MCASADFDAMNEGQSWQRRGTTDTSAYAGMCEQLPGPVPKVAVGIGGRGEPAEDGLHENVSQISACTIQDHGPVAYEVPGATPTEVLS